jgi:hypothetical protein
VSRTEANNKFIVAFLRALRVLRAFVVKSQRWHPSDTKTRHCGHEKPVKSRDLTGIVLPRDVF